MTIRCKAGLIPFYLEFYDEIRPHLREQFQPFLAGIQSALVARGVDTTSAPVCRTATEFRAAIQLLASDTELDALVTVHLAYSPSLEAVEAFRDTELPLILFDTSMDEEFGFNTKPDRLMFNHGIHGVQDFASVLRRRGRNYYIVAGHAGDARALDRVATAVRAARAARGFRNSRTLRIGDTFPGMGDFRVDSEILQSKLGITVQQIGIEPLVEAASQVSEEEVRAEMAMDREQYEVEVSEDIHSLSVLAGLGLRRLLGQSEFSAFSMDFRAFQSRDRPVATVPFLEASKAMARRIGYAGEGDVLTAALVGALAKSFPAVNFTEMFCPNWKEGSIFLSHMGEFNPATAEGMVRMVEKNIPWMPAHNPAILTAPPKKGAAVLVNCAPGPDDSFSLIAMPCDVLGDTNDPDMRNSVRGWIRPNGSLDRVLEQYSVHGGTHHSAIVHGQGVEEIEAFALFSGLPCTIISG